MAIPSISTPISPMPDKDPVSPVSPVVPQRSITMSRDESREIFIKTLTTQLAAQNELIKTLKIKIEEKQTKIEDLSKDYSKAMDKMDVIEESQLSIHRWIKYPVSAASLVAILATILMVGFKCKQ